MEGVQAECLIVGVFLEQGADESYRLGVISLEHEIDRASLHARASRRGGHGFAAGRPADRRNCAFGAQRRF